MRKKAGFESGLLPTLTMREWFHAALVETTWKGYTPDQHYNPSILKLSASKGVYPKISNI